MTLRAQEWSEQGSCGSAPNDCHGTCGMMCDIRVGGKERGAPIDAPYK
ncbi:MAG: hypothetical protein IKX36_03685 [Prevotella sp.]|nr:hypothetical protein [Prevotella sp.]